MTRVVLDTHVVYWWSSELDRLSKPALRALRDADDVAVAAITWFELAWLVQTGRLASATPVNRWIEELSHGLRTIGLTQSISITAATLPKTLGGDPIDRLIYATALETGAQLVTRDERLRKFRGPRAVCVW